MDSKRRHPPAERPPAQQARARLLAPLAAALLAVLAGCASVDPGPSFDAVADTVAARSGLRPAWPRSAEEEAAAETAARELLAAPLTAEAAGRVALLRNRALLAEVEELGIARAEYAQATRLANPTLAGFRRRPSSGGGVNSEIELATDVLDVLVQPLRRRLAAVELEAAKLRLGQTMLDAVAEAKVAFYELVAAEQTVDRLDLVRDLAAAAAELAHRQQAAGNVSELDVARQDAMASAAALDVTAARAEARRARERLGLLLGLGGSSTPWAVERRLPALAAAEPALERLEDDAVASRLDVQAARFGVDLVARALSLKRGTRFFPAGIEVGVNRERETDGVRLRGPQIAIQLPLFDTGSASVARLEAEHRRARRQLEQLADEARSEVRLARDAMLAARELTLGYRDTLLPQRVRILDQTLRHYNMMLLGVYDLLLARRDEVETERAYIEAWRDYWIERTRLERALGTALDRRAPVPPPPPTQENGG